MPGDEARLWAFIRDGHRDAALFPMSEPKMQTVVDRALSRGSPPAVIAVIDGLERIEASLALDCIQPWYSEAWLWADRWLLVHPLHRRSRHAFRLLDFAGWWARHTGQPVVCSIETRTDVDRKIALFRRRAPLYGGHFVFGDPGRAVLG